MAFMRRSLLASGAAGLVSTVAMPAVAQHPAAFVMPQGMTLLTFR